MITFAEKRILTNFLLKKSILGVFNCYLIGNESTVINIILKHEERGNIKSYRKQI